MRFPAAVILPLLVTMTRTAPADPPESGGSGARRSEFSVRRPDGSYRFGYNTGEGQFHVASATPDNTVNGRFGYYDANNRRVRTEYTAGRRGFRARGTDIARKMDLSLNYQPGGPTPPKDGSYSPTYDTYSDPNEDPSYEFNFDTPTYDRHENSDSQGSVTGTYSFVDDVGIKRVVDYVAGSKTGFHVKGTYPDPEASNSQLPYYMRPNKGPIKGPSSFRGHSAIHRGTDGSYNFEYSGPDLHRHESSDPDGNVKGSYSYLDDKGTQRIVHYIAGPNIGFRVVKQLENGPYHPYDPKHPYQLYDYPYLSTHQLPPAPYGAPRSSSEEDDDVNSAAASEALNTAATSAFAPRDRDSNSFESSRSDDFSGSVSDYNGDSSTSSDNKDTSSSSSQEYDLHHDDQTTEYDRSNEQEDKRGNTVIIHSNPISGYNGKDKYDDHRDDYGQPQDKYNDHRDDYGQPQDKYDDHRDDYGQPHIEYDSGSRSSEESRGHRPSVNRGTTRYSPNDSWKGGDDIPDDGLTSDPYSHVKDYSYHPGPLRGKRPARAHIQSIDIVPFGARIASPGDAIEQIQPATRFALQARRPPPV